MAFNTHPLAAKLSRRCRAILSARVSSRERILGAGPWLGNAARGYFHRNSVDWLPTAELD